MSKPQNGRGRYVVKHTCLRPGNKLVKRLQEEFGMAKPTPGGKRDKRLADNRPKTGAGSKGGKVPRRRPRKK